MNLAKIDSSLFCVSALNKEKIVCVVFVSNFELIKQIISSFCEIVCSYPTLKAFTLNCSYSALLNLSSISEVNYITSVYKTSCFLNTAKKIVNVEKLHKQNILGKGVGVAVIDTGCYPHLDFMLGRKKKIHFVDLVNNKPKLYDDNGHGTFVCGVISSSGLSSAGVYLGVAPLSQLTVIKALDESGKAQGYVVLQAMDWVLANYKKLNIRVVCMSFGCSPLTKFDALRIGADALWDAGLVVVSAVGNDGPESETINSPAISSKIISVGSVDNHLRIPDFSSRGPSFDCTKPDVVAPGVGITSLSNNSSLFTQMTGTSVSAPFVAGVAALLLQKFPELKPNEVKARIMYSANPISANKNECGMGLLNGLNAFNFD